MKLVTEVLSYLQIILVGVFLFCLPYIKIELGKSVPVIVEYLVAKLGLINSDRMRVYALEVFHKLNEDTRVGDFAGDKLAEFEKLLTEKFPKITAVQLDLLNKSIAGEINKDKVAVETFLDTPITAKVLTPKYVTEDGTELQPVPKVVTADTLPAQTNSAETQKATVEPTATA